MPNSLAHIVEQPLVSIVVPAHNAERYIGELLDSLFRQTYPHFELLLFDDGSTDGTRSVLSRYVADKRLHVFGSALNIGVNRATSFLLSHMRGKYWAHPGADDMLEVDFLSRRVALLESQPHAILAHGPARYIDEEGAFIRQPYPSLRLPSSLDGSRCLSVLLEHNIINTPSVLIRTDASNRVQQHFQTDWRYAQDWFLWLLLAASGGHFLYDKAALHRYRIHGTSLSNDASKQATKAAETRLVPLFGLSICAQFSEPARLLWLSKRGPLYDLCLLRLLRLTILNHPTRDLLRQATAAYRGENPERLEFATELLRRSLCIAHTMIIERMATRNQLFPVAGLAAINDPIFSR